MFRVTLRTARKIAVLSLVFWGLWVPLALAQDY